MKPRISLEEPRLRVKARAPHIIGNTYFDVRETEQRFERRYLRRAREHRCKHAQPPASLRKALERLTNRAHAAERNERGHEIDGICRFHLAPELVRERGILRAAREERADGEWRRGAERY